MAALAYDLHLHPGPSSAPRWGDGARVWRAAAEAGVRGFVWKSHEEHTVARCAALPSEPVWAIPSASLNPWAAFEDVVEAIEAGARWLWGPTTTAGGAIGWDLPLPDYWERLAGWLVDRRPPLVLATGHADAAGRRAFAGAAAAAGLACSVTHSLYLTVAEALDLAAAGCALEIDAYTYAHDLDGRSRTDVAAMVSALTAAGAVVYLTSDGGQAATGNPFAFAQRVLGDLERELDAASIRRLTHEGPQAMVDSVAA